MRSPSTLVPSKRAGFTSVEVLVVMAIVGFVAAIGTIVGIDTYARYSFHSETESAVSMLQKARSEALSNIGGAHHGVYFGDPSDLVLFQGSSWALRDSALDWRIVKSKTASYADTCMEHSAVFSQLSGETAACTVTITNTRYA